MFHAKSRSMRTSMSRFADFALVLAVGTVTPWADARSQGAGKTEPAAPGGSMAAPVELQSSKTLNPQQEQQVSKLRDAVQKEITLSSEDSTSLTSALRDYVRFMGGEPALLTTVRDANKQKCTSACLVETVRMMGRALERGATEKQAQELVQSVVRDQMGERKSGIASKKDAPDAYAVAEQVRSRFNLRLDAWERDHYQQLEQQKARHEEEARRSERKDTP